MNEYCTRYIRPRACGRSEKLVIQNYFNFGYSYILEAPDLWDLYKCGFHYTQYLFIWNDDKSLPVEFPKITKISLAQRLQSCAVSIS